MPKNKYFQVVPNLNKMIHTEDNDEFAYPLSSEMHLHEERYLPGDELGRGGMKKIIRAEDKFTSRQVAQAFLIDSSEPQNTEAFFKEAKLTAGLQHPNIIPLYDTGFDDQGRAFFTMKPIEGQSLQDLITHMSSDRPIDYPEVIAIFSKICDAMSYAHSRGVLHLDLKPENIQIGEFGEVLVADWGLAKVMHSQSLTHASYDSDIYNVATQHGYIKGTPGYMPPEQIKPKIGKKDSRSDIYSLGAILYALLTQRAPHQGHDLNEIIESTLSDQLVPPTNYTPSTPKSLEAIALKALAFKPADRYQSVMELNQDIKKWQRGFMTSAENQHFLKATYYLLKRHKQATFFLFILLISSFILIASIIHQKNKAQQQELIAQQQKQLTEKKARELLRQKDLMAQQKQQTDQAFILYKQEQEERIEISQKASPRLERLAHTKIIQYNYSEALENINLALLWNPSSEQAHLQAALYSLYSQNFSKSIDLCQAIKSSSHLRRREIIEALSKKYLQLKGEQKYLALPHLMALISETSRIYLTANNQDRPVKTSLHISNYAYTQNYSLDEKILIAEQAMKLSNPFPNNWKLLATQHGSKINIDLSAQKKIYRLEALARLPLHSLNLANTHIKDFSSLYHSAVQDLILTDCNIQSDQLKNFKNLKSVTLSKNQFPNLKLRKLDITYQ